MSEQIKYMSGETGLYFRLTSTPTVSERVYAHLLDLAGEERTEAEVRAALGLTRSTCSAVLAHAARDGLVDSRRVGRTVLYRVNPLDPAVRQLKIAAAIRRAQVALRSVESSVDSAVLFGSASRGEDGPESDIDLLVVTSSVGEVREELDAHPEIQAIVMTPVEHMRQIAEDATLVREAAGGIRILGD